MKFGKSIKGNFMDRNGWIVYNGSLKSPKIMDLVDYFVDGMKERNIILKKISNLEFIGELNGDFNRLLSVKKLEKPDFVILWDKDVTLGRHIEKMGIRVFNSPRSIMLCDNKGYTFEALSEKKIPIPRTIVGPLIYPGREVKDFELFKSIGEVLGYPLVIKECYGSFGAQVYLIEDFEMMKSKIKELATIPYIFQEFISTSFGRDIRVNVVGGNVVGAMLRKSDGDFRANISAGGKGEKYILSDEEKDVAIKASEVLGLDYAGVDLLFGKDGKAIVCEVNSNPHFKSTMEYTGVDVGKSIIDHIIKVVY